MQVLRFCLKNAPFIALAIIPVGFFYFKTFVLPSVGKGSDAAGSGMAQGFAFLFFLALVTTYSLVTIVSLYMYFKNVDAQLVRNVLNLILLLPILFFFSTLISRTIDHNEAAARQRGSYKHWHDISKTKEYRSPGNEFSFKYSTHSRGTFNTAYFEQVALTEFQDGVALVCEEQGPLDIELLGRIKLLKLNYTDSSAISALSGYFSEMDISNCELKEAINHGFELLQTQEHKVFVLEGRCVDSYQAHEKKRYANSVLGNFSSRKVFFVTNSKKPNRLLEVIPNDRAPLLNGPMELNLSTQKIVSWEHTIVF